MGFRDREKSRLVLLKPRLFTEAACAPGTYEETKRDFCLEDFHSPENLHGSIRDEALAYFRKRRIPWHDGMGDKRALPSNHLCCSQSACVNCWFPFVRNAGALAQVLSEVGYAVDTVLPFSADWPLEDGQSPYVAFEWIGTRNYLGELIRGRQAEDQEQSRGAHFTSADFAFRFRRTDGKVQIVLGEWKYTENYPIGKSLRFSKSGRRIDRLTQVYREHLTNPDCQIRLPADIAFEDLFYDPFDQLMRLQLLASAIEREREHADIVSVLHVAPRGNRELMERVTSRSLARIMPGRNMHEIHEALVINGRFKGLYTDRLLRVAVHHASDKAWSDYMTLRYGLNIGP